MSYFNNKKNYLHFFIIFLTSFLLWIIFSFNIGKVTHIDLLKNIGEGNKINNISSIIYDDSINMSKFWEVYNIIIKNNYNYDSIDKEKLVNNTIKWLVNWLDDKHSEYLTLSETEKFNSVLSWDFEWIWAVVEKNPLWVIIDRIIKWSPAKKYWVLSWDIIIKANDTLLEWMSLFDSVDKIKWPAWTKVLLEIIRFWEKEILKIEVIRDKIKIPSVDSKIFENWKISYISINMFWEDTASEFKKVLYKNKNSKWLIIDLRDNWWGYLQSAVSILSNLVEDDKVLVVTKYKDFFSNISYPSINDWNIYNWKIVVLINENSASASEITAWALKDYKKAIIVWKKSYGKWSVQKPFHLKDNSMLKLTIAKWFTPNDINIDKEWINPDIEVDFKKEDYTPEDWKKEEFKPYDRQLEDAKKVLKVFIENDIYQLSIDKYKESIINNK